MIRVMILLCIPPIAASPTHNDLSLILTNVLKKEKWGIPLPDEARYGKAIRYRMHNPKQFLLIIFKNAHKYSGVIPLTTDA